METKTSRQICREIIARLHSGSTASRSYLNKAKLEVARKHRLNHIPSNSELIASLTSSEKERLMPILRRKPTRAISGVTVVAVMTKPHPCPKKEPCIYCPGEPVKGVPQSYTGFEPASMRGIQNRFNPYTQVSRRIKQLEAIGHEVDKIELIVMGGTFPSTPTSYQEYFVKRCLDAITKQRSTSLEEAKKQAEESRMKNVGITIETRPDWARREHVDQFLRLGATRVELGVQNVFEDVYMLVNREHTVQEVVDATQTLKDSGLKVAYHMMLGLPGSSPKRDLEGFRQIFENPRFKPDMIKIYPCLVIKGTKLYGMWRRGDYMPYTNEEAVELICEIKSFTPRWVRIMRIQRDIPSQLIEAGVNKSNLRQLVDVRLRERRIQCKCIRCREVGHRMLKDKVKPENIELTCLKERGSEGEDVFISFEDVDKEVVISYLRLRIPSSKVHRPEISCQPSAIVRELHVCGPLTPVGQRAHESWQHKGYGSVLLRKAEEIASEEYGKTKILVTSALGTKMYYEKFGYKHESFYMSKTLD